MSAHCCGHNATFEGVSADYKGRLWAVIAINVIWVLRQSLREIKTGAVSTAAGHEHGRGHAH
jgi:hypothetical protein